MVNVHTNLTETICVLLLFVSPAHDMLTMTTIMLSWWIVLSFGRPLRGPRASWQIKISSNWFPAEILEIRDIHLTCLFRYRNYTFLSKYVMQQKIPMKNWWIHWILLKYHKTAISWKIIACCVIAVFKPATCTPELRQLLTESELSIQPWKLKI